MYGTMNLKFINAKQAGEVYEYRNTKHKLHSTIAAIWYCSYNTAGLEDTTNQAPHGTRHCMCS
jgi:hypothetical protein